MHEGRGISARRRCGDEPWPAAGLDQSPRETVRPRATARCGRSLDSTAMLDTEAICILRISRGRVMPPLAASRARSSSRRSSARATSAEGRQPAAAGLREADRCEGHHLPTETTRPRSSWEANGSAPRSSDRQGSWAETSAIALGTTMRVSRPKPQSTGDAPTAGVLTTMKLNSVAGSRLCQPAVRP